MIHTSITFSSTFSLTCTYPFTLHFTFCYILSSKSKNFSISLFFLNLFTMKKNKTKKEDEEEEEEEEEKRRRKVKRKREIRSEKKENKRENIVYHHLYHLTYPSPSTSFGSIIIISGTFFVFKSTLFICIFAFNHIILFEIISFYFLQPPHTLHPKDRNPFELHSLYEESELREF